MSIQIIVHWGPADRKRITLAVEIAFYIFNHLFTSSFNGIDQCSQWWHKVAGKWCLKFLPLPPPLL